MICSFLWTSLILLCVYLLPTFLFPVQYTHRVKSLFFVSSSENYYSVIYRIVVHWAIWSFNWNISRSINLSPFQCIAIESPYIIHIYRICISSEKYYFLANHTTTMTPSRLWFQLRQLNCFYLFPFILLHYYQNSPFRMYQKKQFMFVYN